jgi:hypothetical protein
MRASAGGRRENDLRLSALCFDGIAATLPWFGWGVLDHKTTNVSGLLHVGDAEPAPTSWRSGAPAAIRYHPLLAFVSLIAARDVLGHPPRRSC